jgi:hypothetical protein
VSDLTSGRRYWGNAGLIPIDAAPKLVGQTTASDALDDAPDACRRGGC